MKCYDCYMAAKVFESCPTHGRKLPKVKSVKVVTLKPIVTTGHTCPCGEYNCGWGCGRGMSGIPE